MPETVKTCLKQKEDDVINEQGIIADINDADSESDLSRHQVAKLQPNENGCQRVFLVHNIVKAAGEFRPSFVFEGDVVEFQPQLKITPNDFANSKQINAICDDQAILTRSDNKDVHVIQQGLRLSLRYEPPSPKFRREYPGCSSYRMKVFKGSEFLYSMRGLREEMIVDMRAMYADCGPVSFAFVNNDDLSQFLTVIKHVEVVEGQVQIIVQQEEQRVEGQTLLWRVLHYQWTQMDIVRASILGVGVAAGLIGTFYLLRGLRPR
eukprot:TRINITY_DN14240_c0_g1_i2.p1 TRINITY_DN14240_c0_g1~~TRINITY_DN14240_c0_g1_i2.p1  ORF type:complete len:280 (+),score=23.89 TRINITY_DN14240_c0_g1_i2:51-842(+)